MISKGKIKPGVEASQTKNVFHAPSAFGFDVREASCGALLALILGPSKLSFILLTESKMYEGTMEGSRQKPTISSRVCFFVFLTGIKYSPEIM